MKKISIVIATFNAEKTLKRCIDSIVSQKNEYIEIIIIDGGSSDETVKIVKSYGGLIDKFVSEKDKGIYDAWNKGLKILQGEWVMFLGSDDYVLKDSLNKYLVFLSRLKCPQIDIISAKCRYIDENGKMIKIMGEAYDYKTFVRYMNISHGSTLHHKNLFIELGNFNLNYKICADYEFLLRRPLRALFIDDIMICMQTGGMSFSMKSIWESFIIKKGLKDIPTLVNLLYLIRGVLAFSYKRILTKLNNVFKL